MDIYCIHHKDKPYSIAFGIVSDKRRYFDGSNCIAMCWWTDQKCTNQEVVPIEKARTFWKSFMNHGYEITTKGETETPKMESDSFLLDAMEEWGRTYIPVRTDLI